MSGSEQFTIEPRLAWLSQSFAAKTDWIFTDPRVITWRKLPDRENCTLDLPSPHGQLIRLHIKRYPAGHAQVARDEAKALNRLAQMGIPSCALAAWGVLADGRSFIATEDLAGHAPADKLIAGGMAFDQLLEPTALLAAKLHGAGLHHRDLYLCHFFVRPTDPTSVKLIDAARVRPLPGLLTRRRWIVKDLAQFWYSTTKLPITGVQRSAWLEHYAKAAGSRSVKSLERSIESKSRRIASHDAKLNKRQPKRNISIPGS